MEPICIFDFDDRGNDICSTEVCAGWHRRCKRNFRPCRTRTQERLASRGASMHHRHKSQDVGAAKLQDLSVNGNTSPVVLT